MRLNITNLLKLYKNNRDLKTFKVFHMKSLNRLFVCSPNCHQPWQLGTSLFGAKMGQYE